MFTGYAVYWQECYPNPNVYIKMSIMKTGFENPIIYHNGLHCWIHNSRKCCIVLLKKNIGSTSKFSQNVAAIIIKRRQI